MASIIIMTGDQKGNYYPLGHRTNVVGKNEGLLIQILDEHISRKHMQIRFDKDNRQYYALDMKSKHGVFINGSKIDNETALADRDQIHIGQTTCCSQKKTSPTVKAHCPTTKKWVSESVLQ